jgi:PAS domain S-box-containing protein
VDALSSAQPNSPHDSQAFEPHMVGVLESLTDGFGLINRACEITFVSPKCEKLLKLPARELLGRNLWELFPYLVGSRFHRGVMAAFETGRAATLEELSAPLAVWLEAHLEPSPAGLLITLRDITGRKKAEGTERRLVTILETTTDFVSITDAKGRSPYLNRAGRALLGLGEREDIAQTNLVLHPEWATTLVLNVGIPTAMREGVWAGETALLARDGREIPVSQVIIAHKNDRGEVEFLSTIARDISERKRAEEQLIAQAETLREQAELLDHAQDAIVVRGLDHRIVFWNRGAEKMYGWTAEEAAGRDVRELIYAGESLRAFDEAYRHLLAHGEWSGELRHVAKAGQPVAALGHWTLVRDGGGRPKSVLVINTDITARKALEAQFLRAQRMESIGTLASGMAHDLNNVLSPILLAVRILGLKFTDDESQRLLSMLRHSAERGAGLVRQVLAYARGAEGERVTLQPAHLVREIARILNDTFPKSVRLKLSLPRDLWSVTGDPTQLYQVLMNLAVNARDAMFDGGRLTIAAENLRVDEQYARLRLDAAPGRYVALAVTDTGCGIPPELRDKIFEPFFTTKPHGHGTGLGLSTVAGIVKGHGGFVNVYSEVGQGTCFKIYLPATPATEAAEAEEAAPHLPAGSGETVLVVDDEVEILRMTEEVLTAYGYRVAAVRGGAEAVALCRRQGERLPHALPVALVDVMMPGMDGPATIRELLRLSPLLKVIAMSGLSEGGRAQEAARAGAHAFLPKPFVTDTLLQTIARVLAQRREP